MKNQHFNSRYRTCSELLVRLKDPDDQEAWQQCNDLYSPLLFSFARKAGLREIEAQEVCQQTLIALAKKMPAFKYNRSLGSFRSFLLHTARWRIKDQLRNRQPFLRPLREHPTLFGRNDTVNRIPDPNGFQLEEIWDQESRDSLVQAALARTKRRVSAKNFQIFHEYFVNQSLPHQVARLFNVKPDAVYLIKSRVSRVFKDELKKLQSASQQDALP
jgi:RNA polymerase sigma-70 factor (ECF subfamily)